MTGRSHSSVSYTHLDVYKRQSMDSPLNKVNNVVVEENIFGKMLGYGTIRITTSSGEHVFHGVDHPVQLKGVIMSEIQHNKEYDMRKQAEALSLIHI